MLFRKKIAKNCCYCAFGTLLDEEIILCSKKGICSRDGKCRKFRYDPCKRIPEKTKPVNFSKYDQEDFSL